MSPLAALHAVAAARIGATGVSSAAVGVCVWAMRDAIGLTLRRRLLTFPKRMVSG